MALEAPDGRLMVTYYIREITKVLDDWPDAPLAEWCQSGVDCSVELYGLPTWQGSPGLYAGRIVSALTPARAKNEADEIFFYGRVLSEAPADASAEVAEAVAANRMLCFQAPDGRWFATDDVRVSSVRDAWPTLNPKKSSYQPIASWNWRGAGRRDAEQRIYGTVPDYSSEAGGTPVPEGASLVGRIVEVEQDGQRVLGILARYAAGCSGDQLEGATIWPAEGRRRRLGPARFISTHRRWPPIDPDQMPEGRILGWDRAFKLMGDPRRQADVGDIVELFVHGNGAASGHTTQVIGRLERWAGEVVPAHEFIGAALSDPAGNLIGEFSGRVVAVYTKWPDGRHLRVWLPPRQGV